MSRRTAHAFARRKLVVLVAAALAGGVHAAPNSQPAPILRASSVALPITFERNDGQFPASVMFVSQGARAALTLRPGEIVLAPRGKPSELSLRFLHANRAPEIEPLEPLATRSHYYNGNDGLHDIVGVPHYGALRLKDVYPGIDVALHGRDGALEYDFVVAPGADARDIRIDLHGASRAQVDASGNLVMRVGDATLTQHAPVAWQGEGDARHPVDAHFEVMPGTAGPEAHIALGAYDPRESLTIDPVLGYSSYVGGSGGDSGTLVQADYAGNIYYAVQDLGVSTTTTVVTRLDPVTNTILYETHFGGNGTTVPVDMRLGGSASSTVYVAGYTSSTDFPPFHTSSDVQGWIAVLSPNGTIVAERSIGGSGADGVRALALDAAGSVYVGGYTNSMDFPTTTGEPLNRVGASGATDAFVEKLDAGLNPVWARLLGSSANDQVNGLAVDPAGQVIVVGLATGSDFIQVNADLHSPPPTGGATRAFAAKLTPDGTGLAYSEFIGGSASYASAVAIDPVTGDAIVGATSSAAYMYPAPTRAYAGGQDAVVLRLSPSGTPTFATFIGGSANDTLGDLVVNPAGDVYITGTTSSPDFPVVMPLSGQGTAKAGQNAFVTQLRHGLINFSTYLGGSGNDAGLSLALGASGALYVGGTTASVDFPVVTPYRGTRSGSSDAFVARIDGTATRMRDFADLDYDHRTDLIWHNTVNGLQGAWFMYGIGASGTTGLDAGLGYAIKLTGDFNGDGHTDVLYRGADGSYKIQLMNGPAVLQETTILAGGTGWEVVAKGDFNGDGKTDLLWKAPSGAYGMWLMDGTTAIGAGLFQSPGIGWDVQLIADFNGHGRSDILWRNTDGRIQEWVMDGANSTAQVTMTSYQNLWMPLLAGDFDGDGKADIVWSHPDGSIAVWMVDGTTVRSATVLLGANTGWHVKLVADLDGDGKSDIVLAHDTGAVGGWLMNGNAITAATQLLAPFSGWSLVTAGDFNGDGKADLVWRYTDGSYGLWLMNGLAPTNNAAILGPSTGWEVIP